MQDGMDNDDSLITNRFVAQVCTAIENTSQYYKLIFKNILNTVTTQLFNRWITVLV
jgi:hypothetical protein